jgi:hypothetical protein
MATRRIATRKAFAELGWGGLGAQAPHGNATTAATATIPVVDFADAHTDPAITSRGEHHSHNNTDDSTIFGYFETKKPVDEQRPRRRF